MKKAISAGSIVAAVKDQVSADLAGEAAILHLKSGIYYGLDPVGARIWQLLKTPRKVSQIRDALVEEYDVETQTCEKDLAALLEKLHEEQLIEFADEIGRRGEETA